MKPNFGMLQPTSAIAALAFVLCVFIDAAAIQAQTLNMTRVASGLDRPLFVTAAPGDNDRLFILEKNTGDIRILNTSTGTLNATPFLNVGDLSNDFERGLLGLAFHPDYANNGRFFVNATNAAGNTTIREYQRSTADTADAQSRREILSYNQPAGNHNGGWMDFGQDGMLYISSGDGGGISGPGNGQNTSTLLGTMLRIDINGDDFAADPNRNYAIPNNNPFVGQSGADEIYAYGLRNPWRSSFDRVTGDLYIGDVGAQTREEINVIKAGTTDATNLGWSSREGSPDNNVPAGFTDPIYDYTHGSGDFEGQSITGGYVYRGDIAELQGRYFFGDFNRGRLWSLNFDGSDPDDFDGTNFTGLIDWTDNINIDAGSTALISSFGEDNQGNLYLVSFLGDIFRFESASIPEPASGLLVGIPALCLVIRRRRRNA